MGLYFNRTRLRVNDEEWRELACFGGLSQSLRPGTIVQVEINPIHPDDERVRHWGYKDIPTLDQCKQYTDDVLEAFPGVCKKLSYFVFEYPYENWLHHWKLLAVGSLLRYMEEFWPYVVEYHELRANGIPRDVALLCCNVGSRSALAHCGHTFTASLSNLKTLKNFNMIDGYINKLENSMYIGMQQVLHTKPFFDLSSNFPHSFKLTPEVYNEFCKDNIDYLKIQQLVKGRTYRAIG